MISAKPAIIILAVGQYQKMGRRTMTKLGLFDRWKRKPEPQPLVDEKKTAEVARYQAKDHQVIRDLQVRTLGTVDTYIEGKAYCKLWDRNIDVDIYGDAPIEYAEKCVEAINAMSEELVDTICRAARKYCLDFLDAIGGASLNEIELSVPVDADTPPSEMLKCFEVGALVVIPPRDPARIGYQLSGNCDWEEEHGIEIVILDGRLVYLGEFTGQSPWSDH